MSLILGFSVKYSFATNSEVHCPNPGPLTFVNTRPDDIMIRKADMAITQHLMMNRLAMNAGIKPTASPEVELGG